MSDQPICGDRREESAAVADHVHVCGDPPGHTESANYVEQFHDCGICGLVGWHTEPPVQVAGSGQGPAG